MGAPIPGQTTGRSVTPRNILKSTKGVRLNPNLVVLDSTYAYDGANTDYEDELRAGTLLGKITSSGLYRACTRTRVNGALSGTTTVVVDDARAFKVGDTITIGSTTDVVITAITYSTNTMTVDTSTTENDNVAVFCQDGSQTLRGVLDEFVKMKDSDGDMRDMQVGRVVVAGLLDKDQLLGDIDAIIGDDSSNKVLASLQFDSDM